MSKSKSRSPARSEIRFISSLPLDEALQVIGALASPDTPMTLTEINEDTWRFAIGYYEPDKKHPDVTIIGRLRRWHGTYTRLDCVSRVAVQEKLEQSLTPLNVMLNVIGTIIVALLTLIGVPFMTIALLAKGTLSS